MVLAFGSTSCSEFLKGREDDSFQGELKDGEFYLAHTFLLNRADHARCRLTEALKAFD